VKILYLYSEIMGYQIPVLRKLAKTYSAEVNVIHWDDKRLTPYIPKETENVNFYKRSSFDTYLLDKFAMEMSPDIVYISGWQDLGYLPIARKLKQMGKPVVVGFDDQWTGSVRQYIGSALLRLFFRKWHFSHAWVAGPYQYEYARKMGFERNKIIFNLLSCNIDVFSHGVESLLFKAEKYPKLFLYVGNFRKIKGTDILIEAYSIFRDEYKGDWGLLCVGNGPMESLLASQSGIEVKGFSSEDELVEISKMCGAFILPSRFDQWGVVVHEFALTGLPLILSENVGSCPMFLINGHNGYKYRNNSARDLAGKMKIISSMSPQVLLKMGYMSNRLGASITPSSSAASLISVIYS
jgi:glycosyltransferase involved in cell wall biosynthesis